MSEVIMQTITDNTLFHKSLKINDIQPENVLEFPVDIYGWKYSIYVWKTPEKKIKIYVDLRSSPKYALFTEKFTKYDRDSLLNSYVDSIIQIISGRF